MEPVDGAQRRSPNSGLRECLLTALVLYGLAPGNASAGEEDQSPGPRRYADSSVPMRAHFAPPSFEAPSFPAPFAFSARLAETQAFSPTEFRPRKPGLLEAEPAHGENSFIDAPMMRDSSIARVMRESRAQDRVRVLTLWQSRASSLSLQAGKRGAPSLQWSTPWMHRDVASRGLFDRLLPASPRVFGGVVRSNGPRQAGAIALDKPTVLGAPINIK